jgi:hypothetical protein
MSELAETISEQGLSHFLKNPLSALWIIPLVLALVILLPALVLNGVMRVLAGVHPVFATLFLLGVVGVVGSLIIARVGRVLGYDSTPRSVIGRAAEPFAVAARSAKISSTGLLAALPFSTAVPSGSDEGRGEEVFRLPLSDVYLRETSNDGGLLNTGPDFVELERNLSTLVLGEPGAGKTTTINLLLRQMDIDPDEPVVIFDYKGEFDGDDLFPERELMTVAVDGGDVNWNVFREAEDESDYREIASKIVTVDDDQNRNEFFAEAGIELTRAALVHLSRKHSHPTNRELVAFFDQSQGKIYEDLASHDDLSRAADMLGGPDDRTGRDMLSTIRPFISKTFTGDFGTVGGFSVRHYVDDPGGKVLVVQATISQFERTKPAIRFLVDWAIQRGLADPSRKAYYVLDEFQRLPDLRNIENLTGAGRAQQAQAILGLQGITQLESSYDEGLANAIIAGATQEVLMRPGDPRSIEHIQDSVGSEIVEHEEEGPGFGRRNVKQEEVRDFSQRDLRQFRVGEAIVTTKEGFVHGRVKQWADLSARERERLL